MEDVKGGKRTKRVARFAFQIVRGLGGHCQGEGNLTPEASLLSQLGPPQTLAVPPGTQDKSRKYKRPNARLLSRGRGRRGGHVCKCSRPLPADIRCAAVDTSRAPAECSVPAVPITSPPSWLSSGCRISSCWGGGTVRRCWGYIHSATPPPSSPPGTRPPRSGG